MIRKIVALACLLILAGSTCRSQAFIKTADLFTDKNGSSGGKLTLNQDPALDSLISRYIISKSKLKTMEDLQGMDGFMIQIYYSSVRTAREESSKIRADFISKFPHMTSYNHYMEPGWFMVRAGDYRTRAEGYKDLLTIRKVFPNAYLVPATINYPDLIKK